MLLKEGEGKIIFILRVIESTIPLLELLASLDLINDLLFFLSLVLSGCYLTSWSRRWRRGIGNSSSSSSW